MACDNAKVTHPPKNFWYDGGSYYSESTIRHYVREANVRLGVRNAQVFIPLDPECVQEAEVDWGNGLACIKGVKTRIRFLLKK